MEYKQNTMKKILPLSLLFFALSACQKEECFQESCFNGGIWNSGYCKCECMPYYSGKNCEEYNPPCKTSNYGTLYISNSHSSPYRVYRDGSYYAYVYGNGSFTDNQSSASCSSWRFEQASGYVFYPTVYTDYECVSQCGFTSIFF